MERTKQVLRTFTLDAETQEAMTVLKRQGFNLSQIIRDFLKEKAKQYTETK